MTTRRRAIPRSWRGWLLLAIVVALAVVTAWNLLYLFGALADRPEELGRVASELVIGLIAVWAMVRMDGMQGRLRALEGKVDQLAGPRPGRCGERFTTGITPSGWVGYTGPCSLDAGHAGWHRHAESGAEWSHHEEVVS